MPVQRVLVAFGTKNGSTAEIAEMIGVVLRGDGTDVHVRPAGEVRDVTGYDAVVLGGAVYMGRWHRDARRFARRYATALEDRPVWLFSSGPLDRSANERDIPPTESAAHAMRWLHARGHVTFGGRLGEDAKGLVARLMVRSGRSGDFRDPERIQAWTHGIAEQLRAGETVP